ncbi:MAG: hypothetical protein ACSHYF_11285 [Verrucomicrobiaceae bacterium]
MKFPKFNFPSFGKILQSHEHMTTRSQEDTQEGSPIPKSSQEAHVRLHLILSQRANIRDLSHDEFLQGWFAMAYIAPGLNPDEVLNKDGGWPSGWRDVGGEAFRRFSLKEITREELYPHPSASS